ncbi:MAG: glycosyltransferase [Paludibacteraceae bacterium]|nr:glycosyltransferase [Paludibacteraceae bacterium]
MHIVILGTAYPYRGGLAAFNERLARQFQSEGHSVRVYTFKLQYPDFLFPGKTQYSDEPEPQDLDIQRQMNSVNPFNWIKVGKLLKKERPDLLVVKFWLPMMAPCLGTIARIARHNKKTRVISVLDNIIPHEHRVADRVLARYFVKSVDGFVAMSESVLNDVGVFDNRKPRRFSPHPLYDNFGMSVSRGEALSYLKLDHNMRYLLFFGLIRDYKGLDLLLQAYADERIDKSKVRLIVAGEFYNNGDQYRQLEEQLGLQGLIEWRTHFVPDHEVRYYFSAADLIVQPYKSATQSGVTQIAYHFERPMIVTRVGGLAEIVPDRKVGYVCEVSPQSIADAIVDFYADNVDRFHDALVREKQKYAWNRMTETIMSL